MYGSLTVNPSDLPEDEQRRYRSVYCGLCRTLKKRYGNLSRFLLNYDCTFLLLFLEALYEPSETCGCNSCIAHPFEKREWEQSEINNYAADMTAILAYYKCLDDWHDDKRFDRGATAYALRKIAVEVREKWPRQCSAIENGIRKISEMEQEGEKNPDLAAELFGSILAEIFVYQQDRWEMPLRKFGHAVGCFIYLNDAAVDLNSDKIKGRYNPFLADEFVSGNAFQTDFLRSVLKAYLADALQSLDYLPIVQDIGIIDNILCSGVWLQFNKKYDPGKESTNV